MKSAENDPVGIHGSNMESVQENAGLVASMESEIAQEGRVQGDLEFDGEDEIGDVKEIEMDEFTQDSKGIREEVDDQNDDFENLIVAKSMINDFDFSVIQSDNLDQKVNEVRSGLAVSDLKTKKKKKVSIFKQGEDFHYNGKYMGGRLFGFIGVENPVRQAWFKFVHSTYYNSLLYSIICVNLIMMALQPPYAKRHENPRLYAICDWFDVFGIAFYTMDVLLKALCLGLVTGKHAYLKSVWNVFDVMIVVIGWVSIISGYHLNASILKSFIFLKALMAITVLREIKAILVALTNSVPYLLNVSTFLFLFFIVFSIMGIEFYKNSLARRCFLLTDNGTESCIVTEDGIDVTRNCVEAYPQLWCANEGSILGMQCPGDMVCIRKGLKNPNGDWTKFDHFGTSLLTLLQIVSLTNWTSLLYPLMQSESPELTALWFFCLIVILNFVVVNLFLAIITSLFSAIRSEQREELLEIRKFDDEYEKRKEIAIEQGLPWKEPISRRFRSLFRRIAKENPLVKIPLLGPKIKKIHQKFSNFINGKTFNIVTLAIIFVQVALQATAYHGMSVVHVYVVNTFTIIFFVIYVIEMGLRLIAARNIVDYASDIFNQLDIFLLILQGIGIVIYAFIARDSFLHKFGFLRALRVLKVLNMIPSKQTKKLRSLLQSTIAGAAPSLKILLVIAYCLFVASVLGVQLYGHRLFDNADDKEQGKTSRENFNNIYFGSVTLFQIMTSDDWTTIFYRAIALKDGFVAVFFFITFYLFSAYVLLNLFTAAILEQFSPSDEEISAYRRTIFQAGGKKASVFSVIHGKVYELVKYLSRPPKDDFPKDPKDAENNNNSEFTPIEVLGDGEPTKRATADIVEELKEATDIDHLESTVIESFDEFDNEEPKLFSKVNQLRKNNRVDSSSSDEDGDVQIRSKMRYQATDVDFLTTDPKYFKLEELDDLLPPEEEEEDPYDESLDVVCLCLTSTNPFRRFLQAIVNSRWFEHLMTIIVLLSALVLVFEPVREADLTKSKDRTRLILLEICEWILLVIFVVEFVAKILANGFVLSKKGTAYFEDPWNWFDFFLVLVMLFTTTLRRFIPNYLRLIRMLRALRPLRVLRNLPGLRPLLLSIWTAIPNMVNIFFGSFFFLLLFGIAGTSMFAGKFYSCNDASVTGIDTCIGYFENELGIFTARTWSNPPTHFDNVGASMLALFEVASLSDWRIIMWRGMDIESIDEQPRRDVAPYYALYFMIFIFVGTFFIINIVIGVILESVDRYSGKAYLSESQQKWITIKRELVLVQPIKEQKRPKNILRRPFYYLVHFSFSIPKFNWNVNPFNNFMLIVIMLNTILMCTKHSNQTDDWTLVLRISNWVFVTIFLIELIIKLMAYSIDFFRNAWNVFDLFIILGALISSILSEIPFSNNTVSLGVAFLMRLFGILRVFRIIPSFPGLAFMFKTLVVSSPAIVNILILLFGLLYIYALIAMELFGSIKFGFEINRDANFRSFFISLVTLFRIATLDSWNGLLHDVIQISPFCTKTSEWDDCGSRWSYIYFITYYLIGSYIILNLVTGVIIDNFSAIYQNIDSKGFDFSRKDIKTFQKVWAKFDPKASGIIARSKLDLFIQDLQNGFIFKKGRKPSALGFNILNNKVPFTLFMSEIKLGLEEYEVDEMNDNLFERLRESVFKCFTKVRLRYFEDPSLRNDHVTFREVLFLLAKFAIGDHNLTHLEASKRHQALKVAVVYSSVRTIEKFFKLKVKGNKRNYLGYQDNSDDSSVIEEDKEYVSIPKNFIAKYFETFPPNIDLQNSPPEQISNYLLKKVKLNDFSVPMKQMVDLNCVKHFFNDRSLFALILDPDILPLIEWNGFSFERLEIPMTQVRNYAEICKNSAIFVKYRRYMKNPIDLNGREVFMDDFGVERVRSWFLTRSLGKVFSGRKVGIQEFMDLVHKIEQFKSRNEKIFDAHLGHRQKNVDSQLTDSGKKPVLLHTNSRLTMLQTSSTNTFLNNFFDKHFKELRPDFLFEIFEREANRLVRHTILASEKKQSNAKILDDANPNDYWVPFVSKSMYNQNFKVFCGTWNSSRQPLKEGLLDSFIPLCSHDIYAITIQDCCTNDTEMVQAYLQQYMGETFLLVSAKSLYNLHLCVFIREELLTIVNEVVETCRTCSSLSLSICGGVGIGFKVNQTRVFFFGAHLSPDTKLAEKNQYINDMLDNMSIPNCPFDVSTKYDYIFFMGSFQYDIEMEWNTVKTLYQSKEFEKLLEHDELTKQRQHKLVFEHFSEGKIQFQPNHVELPSFCSFQSDKFIKWSDRVLWRSSPGYDAICLKYSMTNTVDSDHRPVSATFDVSTAKYVQSLANKYQLKFERIEITEVTKEFKRPRIHFFGDSVSNTVSSDKTLRGTNPKWMGYMLPPISLNGASIPILSLGRLNMMFFDGHCVEEDNRFGRAILPLWPIIEDNFKINHPCPFKIPLYGYGRDRVLGFVVGLVSLQRSID